MAKKRAGGEGSIFQRADGRWSAIISLGFDKDGKRQRKQVYGTTQTEVRDKLEDLKQQKRLAGTALASKDTLAAYLQSWLDTDVSVNRSGKTVEEYASSVKLQTIPFIGNVRLTKLSGDDLQRWQAKLKKQGFSDNQRLRSIRVLRNALNKAVKLSKIPFNPCNVLDKPRVERKEVRPLEREQCHKLFAAAAGHRVGDVITLALMTGLRKRELFALEWSAVDLSEGVLTVRRSLQELADGSLNVKMPKTRAGRRVVTLEPIAVQALQNRLEKAKSEGFDPDLFPIIFPDTRGGYLRGSNFDRQCWYPIREAAEIPSTVTFHDLRHSHASLMLHAGVDLKVIQTRLGHADFATTANVYSHLMQDAQAAASGKLGEMMAQNSPK